MKNFKTAKEAIQHSVDHDTIAFCENTDENREYLATECDDYTDSNEGYEYWSDAEESDGTDGKMEWRVHVITND